MSENVHIVRGFYNPAISGLDSAGGQVNKVFFDKESATNFVGELLRSTMSVYEDGYLSVKPLFRNVDMIEAVVGDRLKSVYMVKVYSNDGILQDNVTLFYDKKEAISVEERSFPKGTKYIIVEAEIHDDKGFFSIVD